MVQARRWRVSFRVRLHAVMAWREVYRRYFRSFHEWLAARVQSVFIEKEVVRARVRGGCLVSDEYVVTFDVTFPRMESSVFRWFYRFAKNLEGRVKEVLVAGVEAVDPDPLTMDGGEAVDYYVELGI